MSVRFQSNKLFIPLITIMGSAALFFAYYLFYVSWQENYANERAFRLLSVVGDQLGKRFGNLQSVMAAALVYSQDGAAGRPARRTPSEYLREVPGYADQISVVDSKGPCPEGWKREGEMKLRLLDNPGAFSLGADFQAFSAGKLEPCFIKAKVNPAVDLRERFHNLTADYFDDILIAASTGEVLFESNLSGFRISNLDTLVSSQSVAGSRSGKEDAEGSKTKTNPFHDVSQFSNVREVRLAGSVYKLYVQPAALRITVAGDDNQYLKTLVCGLWRIDRQQSQLVSIPYATLIWGVLIALAVFGMLWPLLKVAYMSPTERLKRAHVFYLLSSGLFVTAILTVIVLNAAYMKRANDESREQLDSLAGQIDENVRSELARALTLMNELECDPRVGSLLEKATRRNWTSTRFLESSFFEQLTPASYPYFDNVFWTDEEGRQLFKLTVRGEATPQTSVKDNPYFQYVLDVNQRHLTSLGGNDRPAGLDIPKSTRETPFRFEPLYSPNTGEYIVVIAKSSGTGGDLPVYLKDAKAQVLVTRFLSLAEPALPAGFGFAVVDHDGLVQFHSTAGRNQIEDFFKESREHPVLKALIVNGASDFVNADYNGKQQLMRVQPLPYLADPPLTLVVFRDTNYFTTVNVACMLVFGLLAGLFALPFVAGLALYVIRRGGYPLEPFWPSPVHGETYLRIVASGVCLAAAFFLRFPAMAVDGILGAVVVVAAASTFFGIFGSKGGRQGIGAGTVVVLVGIIVVAGWSWALLAAPAYLALSGSWLTRRIAGASSSMRRVSLLYLAAAFCLLTVLVVLPCFGLFKIAYSSVNRLDLETALRDRLDLLAHRAEALREYFAGLETAPGEHAQPPSQTLKAIQQLRIAEKLDRYDDAIFWPSDAQPSGTSELHVTPLEKGIAWATGWLPNNVPGAKLRETAMAETTETMPWQHGQSGDDEVLALESSFQGNVPEGVLRGVYPMWQLPLEPAILMGGLAILLAAWLSYMIRKIFLTDLAKVPPLDFWAFPEHAESNLLIIGHPKSGRSTQAAQLEARDWIDLAQVATAANWTLPELQQPTVVVDHFEFDVDNSETCMAKLKLLEELVYVRNKRVVVLSTVDPMFYMAAGSPEIVTPHGLAPELAPLILDRWASVLSSFAKYEMEDLTKKHIDLFVADRERRGSPCPAELVRLVKEECDHTAQLRRLGLTILDGYCSATSICRAEVVEELLDRADAYYRVLWSTCSKQERLVLFQLARDGWANPKNERAIQQLERRRLVTRSPGLRIMNESFCRFVNTAQLPSEVAKWEEEVQNSAWSAMKLGFTTAAVAGGAWLLYTQQDLFQVGIGYLAAMGTASGAVISLIKNVSHTKGGGPAEKAGA